MTPSVLRSAVPDLAVLAAAPPLGIAAGEGVELSWHFYKGAGDVGVADAVLALVGIDVPFVPSAEAGESLVSVAVAALDRHVADVDLVGHALPPGRHSPMVVRDLHKLTG